MEDPNDPGTFFAPPPAGRTSTKQHDPKGRNIHRRAELVMHLLDPKMHRRSEVAKRLRAHYDPRDPDEPLGIWRPILTAVHYQLHGVAPEGIGGRLLADEDPTVRSLPASKLPSHRG